MLNNQIKIVWRNLLNNTMFSILNIGGLALGMSVALLIGLWIFDEVSFNSTHENNKRIAQVLRHFDNEGEIFTGGHSSPIPLASELRNLYKSDFDKVVISSKPIDYIISFDDAKFIQTGKFMDVEAPEMFSLDMVYGNWNGLKNMNSILISETLSKKLFGESNPIDHTIIIDSQIQVKVTGVYEDFPINSEFHEINFIAPFNLYVTFSWAKRVQDNWNQNGFPIYVQIAPGTTFELVSSKIKDIMLPHLDERKAKQKPQVFLHPMKKWHLYSEFKNGKTIQSSRMKIIRFYGIIGVFVLLLACINFMNLNTANSIKRSKEIGVRKSIGSGRLQLVLQFLGESLIVTLIALTLSILMVLIILPWFNGIADKELTILWSNSFFWVFCILFSLLTGIFAGFYPAVYMSSFNVIKALKGNIRINRYFFNPRKLLVVIQFSISIALIAGTLSIYQQIQFAKNRPIGYDCTNLIRLFKTSSLQGKSETLRAELLQSGVINEIGESSSSLTDIRSGDKGFNWKNKNPAFDPTFGTLRVSYEYGKTIGWKFIEGRDFSREFLTDSTGVILNESAVKIMGLAEPLGESIHSKHLNNGIPFKVLGVVEDMVMKSPFEPTEPTMFFLGGGKRWIFAKINSMVNVHEALSKIELVVTTIAPSVPFEFSFVDKNYGSKFVKEQRLGKVVAFFSILAILISCLGLFGLSIFIAEQSEKEIGIRKVLGASIISLWSMQSKGFIAPIFIASLIAVPISYYFLREWLQSYEYRIEISSWIFVVTIVGALLISIFTVSFQAIRAASTNPIKSLRME